jgi:hypothetical protein
MLNYCFYSLFKVGTACALQLAQILVPMVSCAITYRMEAEMKLNRTQIIATIVISGLFAASTALADDKDAVAATTATATATATDTTELNRNLAEAAHTAAVEDAIEGVLAANKLDLDIRFIGRTSVSIADGR